MVATLLEHIAYIGALSVAATVFAERNLGLDSYSSAFAVAALMHVLFHTDGLGLKLPTIVTKNEE